MSYTQTGSDIVQEGVNNSLDGVEVTNAVRQDSGSGNSTFSDFFTGSNRFILNGDLTIDPRREKLATGNAGGRSMIINGTLHLGIDIIANGHLYRSQGTGLQLNSSNLASCCSGEALDLFGTLIIKGTTMDLAACMRWNGGSNTTIEDGIINCTRSNLMRIRVQRGAIVNVAGLQMIGNSSIDWFTAPQSFDNFFPVGGERACEVISSASGGTNDEYTFPNYNSLGMLLDFSVWQGSDLHFPNLAKEDDLIVTNTNINGGRGLTRVSKDLIVSFSDGTNGTDMQDAQYFIQATNGGNTFAHTPRSGVDYMLSDNLSYRVSATAGGATPVTRVLTRFNYINANGGGQPGDWYYTSNNNDLTDIYTVHLHKFGFIKAQTTLPLRGPNVLDFPWTLFRNATITATRAEVQAYTSVDNLDELNHADELWLDQGLGDFLERAITATGNAGGFDMSIDPNHALPYEIVGNVINIRSSNFSGNLITTGTVTGVEFIDGAVSDSNGDSTVNITTPAEYDDSIRVYGTLDDALAETNELASGQSIRYQSAEFGGLELFFRAERADGVPAFGSHVISTEAGIFDVNIATTSENSALGSILSVTETLRTMIEEVNGVNTFRQSAVEQAVDYDRVEESVASVVNIPTISTHT